MLWLRGLLLVEATGADSDALEEFHGHRVLRVRGKGDKVAFVPLPPAVGRAIDRATDGRTGGAILRSRTGNRMDRHCATRRLRALAKAAGSRPPPPRRHHTKLRPTLVTTLHEAGVVLRAVKHAAGHARHRTTTRDTTNSQNPERTTKTINYPILAIAHLTTAE